MGVKTLVLAESDEKLGLNLARSIESEGHVVVRAPDGVAAIALVNRRRPDCVLVNVSLPCLDGIEVCDHLKSDAETSDIPVVLIAIRPDRSTVERAIRAGADDVVMVTGTPRKALLERIARLLAPKAVDGSEKAGAIDSAGTPGARVPGAISEASLERKLSRISEAKGLPFIAAEIVSVTSSRDASISDLVDLIERDQAVTAKVLKLANSSMYGGRGRTVSLKQAVSKLGFNGVSEMVLGMSVLESYGESDGLHLDRIAFWRHCMAVAAIAEALAGSSGGDVSETALVAGLLHDIGKAIADDVFPEVYGHIIARARDEEIPLLKAETALLGIDHTAIGMRVARSWRLPKNITSVIGYHHKDWSMVSSIPDRLGQRLVGTVKLADILARVVGYGHPGDDTVEHITDEALQDLGYTDKKVKDGLSTLERRLKELEGVFLLHENPPEHDEERPSAEGAELLLVASASEISTVELMLDSCGYSVERASTVPEDIVDRAPDVVVFEGRKIRLVPRLAETLGKSGASPRLVAVGDPPDDAELGAEELASVPMPFTWPRMLAALGLSGNEAN